LEQYVTERSTSTVNDCSHQMRSRTVLLLALTD
jgi:hypothetical protein